MQLPVIALSFLGFLNPVSICRGDLLKSCAKLNKVFGKIAGNLGCRQEEGAR
jgi:hypothetical protein